MSEIYFYNCATCENTLVGREYTERRFCPLRQENNLGDDNSTCLCGIPTYLHPPRKCFAWAIDPSELLSAGVLDPKIGYLYDSEQDGPVLGLSRFLSMLADCREQRRILPDGTLS